MGWAARANRETRQARFAIAPPKVEATTPAPAQPVGEAKAIARLREVALRIENLAQFNDMVLLSGQPDRFRALLEPMLRPNLPCCAHSWNGAHQKRCPKVLAANAPRLVMTPEEDLASQFGSRNAAGAVIDDDRPRLVGPDGQPLG